MKKFAKNLLALSLMGAAVAASADDKVLHVYNWSDYIAEDTIAKFEKESGIKVVYDVFDSNETLEAKLLAGKSGYDIVVPSNNFLAKQIKAGVYEPLDKSKLPNWSNLNESLLKAVGDASDPGNQYAFPYMWGTIGIGYNPDKVKKALGIDKIDSWDVVLKPENLAKLKSCGVSFLDSPTEMIPVAQHYLGLPTGTEQTKAQIDQAKGLFLKIRPSISYFHSSKYISDLANGNICVAVGYSGDVQQAKSRAKDAGGKVKVEYTIPKEGAGSFYDMVAIPKDAENKEGAYKFMNFLMQPEVMAEITNAVQFPNGNAKATPLVDEAIREDKSIYPSEEVQAKLYAINGNLSAALQRDLTRAWTQIKTGK